MGWEAHGDDGQDDGDDGWLRWDCLLFFSFPF
jgi:hypothetical protein